METAWDLADRAEQSCRLRECETAIRALRALVQLQPRRAEVHYRLGLCVGGSCTRHSLVDPEAALSALRKALDCPGTQPLLRAQILGALGNTWRLCLRLTSRTRLESAIACHQEAAKIYLKRKRCEDWAREQYNLGIARCELESESPDEWRAAIEAFESALLVRTPERDALGRAATMLNLGTAYRALPDGDRRRNVINSVRCYHHALRTYRRAGLALKAGAVYNNLANACLSFPASDSRARRRLVTRAVRYFDKALETRTKNDHLLDYAVTQFNRGQALLELGDANRDDAVRCLCEAHECFERCGQLSHAREAQDLLSQAALSETAATTGSA